MGQVTLQNVKKWGAAPCWPGTIARTDCGSRPCCRGDCFYCIVFVLCFIMFCFFCFFICLLSTRVPLLPVGGRHIQMLCAVCQHCQQPVERSAMTQHKKKECLMRIVDCPRCNEAGLIVIYWKVLSWSVGRTGNQLAPTGFKALQLETSWCCGAFQRGPRAFQKALGAS